MAVEKQVTTLEEFIEFVHRPENADRLFEFIDGRIVEKGEFIHGEIVEKMPGRATNSAIHTLISFFARLFCRQHGLSCFIATADGAFDVLGRVYAPDFAFTTTPFTGDYPEPNAPLWVAEIISPTDRPFDIRTKRQLYLQAGILLWEVYPEAQSIDVYAPGQPVRTLGMDDTLDGGDVLPGFTLPVREIFTAVSEE